MGAESAVQGIDPKVNPATLTDEQLSGALKTMGANQPTETPPEEKAEVKPEVKPEPRPEGGELPADALSKLTAEIASLNKRLSEKDKFIGRQSAEVGELRKKLREVAEAGRAEFKEKYIEDPAAAMDARDRAIVAEREIANLDSSERASIARDVVHAKLPDFDTLVPDIAEIALEDGEPPELVELFKRNPYGVDPAHLLNYGRRAILRRKVKEYDTKLTGLSAEVEKLKKGSDTIVEKIAGATAPVVIPAGGGSPTPSSASAPLSDKRIASMTDAELKAELAKRMGR